MSLRAAKLVHLSAAAKQGHRSSKGVVLSRSDWVVLALVDKVAMGLPAAMKPEVGEVAHLIRDVT